MRRYIPVALLVAVVIATVGVGCNGGPLDKVIAYQAAVQVVQALVGTDYAKWAQAVNEAGAGRWQVPITLAEGTDFFASFYRAFQETKGTATSRPMSVAGVVSKVQTKDGSGEELLNAFHTSDGR